MTLLTDHKYVGLISGSLSQFKRKDQKTYNFRCPICGDSKRNRLKARGYFFENKDHIVFKCHNCSVSMSLGKFIEKIDFALYKQYKLESFQTKGEKLPVAEILFSTPKKVEKINPLDDILPKISTLPYTHRVIKYCEARRIPKERYDDLYYAKNMKDLEQLSERYKGRITEEERLVIPFRDGNGNLSGCSGRAISASGLRYVTIRITDNPLIYGLNKVNANDTIYVVEGPIDSMFIPNCIAAGGSDFKKVIKMFNKEKIILLFDNQPRNKQVISNIEMLAKYGYSMVIWPNNWKYKDINEAIIDNISQEEILKTLNKSTYRNLELKLAIAKWKKC